MNPTYDAAYQGNRGAYSEIACWDLLGRDTRLLPCERFEEVFVAADSGTARFGVIPVENTLVGSVIPSIDLLIHHRLYAIGETVVRVEHAVVGAPGVQLRDVKFVLSHPVALAQCERFFRSHPEIQAVPEFDTAGAVEKVIRENRRDAAAIAGSRTAAMFGGVVLADKIQDYAENFTRFLLLSRDERPAEESGRLKTTVVFKLANIPGALSRALKPFAERGIDLTKIESRPIKESPFEYFFYVDVVSEAGQARVVKEAMADLAQACAWLRVLGTYRPYVL